MLHNAGECFEAAASLGVESDDYRKAGSAYTSAEEFDSATKVYVQCDLFDEAVQVIQENRTKMNPSVVEQTLHLAKLFYFKKREYKCVLHVGCSTWPLTRPQESAGSFQLG